MKLEFQGKTLQKDLKKKIEKKEPAVSLNLFSKTKRPSLSKSLKITK
jgi:hypothetical protein